MVKAGSEFKKQMHPNIHLSFRKLIKIGLIEKENSSNSLLAGKPVNFKNIDQMDKLIRGYSS